MGVKGRKAEMKSQNRGCFSTGESKGADISAGKESADQIASGDRQVQVRRVRLVVVNGNPGRARAAQVVTGESLQRVQGRLIVGALDANGNAFAGLEQARRRYNWNA
jgi:hypothetical protein